jgi:cytolysin-activating lysine-acyltransferase
LAKAPRPNGTVKPDDGSLGNVADPIDAVSASLTLDERREAVQTRFGQLALGAMRLKRYQGLGVGELEQLLLVPLLANCVAFAESGNSSATPVGMAIWASVSEDVARRIAAQVDGGVFPVRLAKEDWRSGDQVWLLDLLVPTQKAGTSVFMNFSKLVDNRPFRMHPVVLQSVESAVVERLREAIAGASPKPES